MPCKTPGRPPVRLAQCWTRSSTPLPPASTPMIRTEAGRVETSWNSAMGVAAQLSADAAGDGSSPSIGLLGGARGTNEDAFAWARLADAVGIDRRDVVE